jgi:hypothetical protein
MEIGQLFVKLKLVSDKVNENTTKKFVGNLKGMKEKAMDLAKQAKVLLQSKFSHFFKESEFASVGLLGKMADIIGKANMMRLAIMGAVAGMIKLTSSAAEASEHLFKFSINTGMDTQALQRWQAQAGQAGVQAEEVADSFKNLQRKSMEVQMGQGDAGAFQMSGVNWFADAQTQMKQIQAMLKNRPAAMGTKLASDMGLSEEMISFLRMKDSLESADENLILSEKEIAELKDFSLKFKGTWYSFQQTLVKIGAMILPITKPFIAFAMRLMKMTTQFTAWMNEIPARKNGIITAVAAIGTALAVAFFPATATVLGIGAVIAGILLIMEDIATFLRGGDSLTGDLINGAGGAVKSAFGGVIDWVRENWKMLLDWMWTEVKNFGELIWSLIKGIAGLGFKIGELASDGIKGVAASAWEGLKGLASDAWKGLSGPMPSAPSMALGASGGMVQNVQIQVDGSKDPKAVGEEVSRRLRQETSQAVYQMPRQEH